MEDIDLAVYINLKERTDRKFFCENQLINLPFKWQRFEGINHKKGYIGRILSHISVLKFLLNYLFIYTYF